MKGWVRGYSVPCGHGQGTVGILGIERFGTLMKDSSTPPPASEGISLIPLLYDQNVGLLQVLKFIVMGRATLKQFAGK